MLNTYLPISLFVYFFAMLFCANHLCLFLLGKVEEQSGRGGHASSLGYEAHPYGEAPLRPEGTVVVTAHAEGSRDALAVRVLMVEQHHFTRYWCVVMIR
jgi:hypothetical protein